MSLGTIGIAVGLGGAVVKGIEGIHQNDLANQIHPAFQQYNSSPYAAQQLGIAQQLFNGRMAGAPELERNIATAQGNTVANINRNASSGSQALALASGAQNTANDAYGNLQTKELQNKYSLLDNLNKGYGAMTNEGDKVYQSQFGKYQSDLQQQSQLRGAGWQNIFSGIGDVGSGLALAGQQSKQNDFQKQLLGMINGGSGGKSLGGLGEVAGNQDLSGFGGSPGSISGSGSPYDISSIVGGQLSLNNSSAPSMAESGNSDSGNYSKDDLLRLLSRRKY